MDLCFNDRCLNKYSFMGNFHNGLALVRNRDGLYGYINTEGKEVIPCQFESAEDFKDGYASVYSNRRFYMDNFNITFPYPIGTYLSKVEDGITHIDRLEKYIIEENGISVIVMLDALTEPRLSTPIDLDIFISNWTKTKTNKKRIKE